MANTAMAQTSAKPTSFMMPAQTTALTALLARSAGGSVPAAVPSATNVASLKLTIDLATSNYPGQLPVQTGRV